MRILFVSDGSPFPPKNGVQLPLARIIEFCATRAKVDLLYVNCDMTPELFRDVPTEVDSIHFISAQRNCGIKKVRDHLDGKAFISNRYNVEGNAWEGIQEYFDWVWVSPVSLISLYHRLLSQQKIKTKRYAIGHNDIKYHLYRDSINELKYGTFSVRYISDWAKSFLIKSSERDIVCAADLVHVQTEKERTLALGLHSDGSDTFVVAKNGVNGHLYKCLPDDSSPNILYMTHLQGGRLNESRWFITKVWPGVKALLPGVRLIIVGNPPASPIPYLDDPQIEILGYVDNLVDVYSNARLAVVPTFHGTGLINRIQDALTAGLPAVSTPQAISTFVDLVPGEHILSAQGKEGFRSNIVRLFNDHELRKNISRKGRQFIKEWGNSWEETCELLFEEMKYRDEGD